MPTPGQFGPEGKSGADVRLNALKSHQKAVAEAPTEASGKQRLVDTLLPLMLAQGLDLLSTEKPMGFLQHPGTFEANPLPGMKSTAGRVGWGGLELLAQALLAKKAPKLSKIARNTSIGVHTGLTLGNEALKQQFQGNRMSRTDIVSEMMRGK